MKYSIIIPTKNEEAGIAKVICSIPKVILKRSEILIVDSSTDMTPIIAKRFGAKVIQSGKGKGRAMKAGVKASHGNILIFLDGDGTDPPQFIPKLLEELKTANMVLGSRTLKYFKNDDPATKRVFKLYGHLFAHPLSRIVGFKIKGDPLAGFRVIKRADWDKLKIKSNGFEIEAEINVKATENKFIVKEVPIPHLARVGGLRNSKFINNPRAWIRIVNVVSKYSNKRIKHKLAVFIKKLSF